MSNWAVGASLKHTPGFFSFILSYEYSHILSVVDWRQKNHVGLEIGIPRFKLAVGLNQAYVTGGLTFDFPLLKLQLATYAQELGTFIHQQPNRRVILRIDFNFKL